MTPPRPLGAALAGLVAAGVLVAPAPATGAGAADDCTSVSDASSGSDEEPETSIPAEQLQIAEVHDVLEERGTGFGRGVTVAVVANGIAGGVPGTSPTAGGAPSHYLGTAVAGVITTPGSEDGVAGFAPGAQLRDVKVYDEPATDDSDAVGPETQNLVNGLKSLVDAPVHIVVVPMAVPNRSKALGETVRSLVARGKIVVAAGGDRPAEEGDPLADKYGGGDDGQSGPERGEDAAKDVWPAGYPEVVAVGSTVPDGTNPSDSLLQNSAIDIAVPTLGAVSTGLNGAPCELSAPSTAVAAGEVAGILALLKSAHPDDNPRQLLARLYETATGSGEVTDHNMFTGRGVAQPLEAVLRPMRPDESGKVASSSGEDRLGGPAAVPEKERDVIAEIRGDAVWWGLVGAGALLIALLLSRVVRSLSRQERR